MAWPYVDMLELEARVRDRADLSTKATNPQFVSQEEVHNYIQKSWEKLYNYLVGKYEDYFVKIADEGYLKEYTTEAAGLIPGYKDYSLPLDYFKLIKIDLFDGQGSAPSAAQRDEHTYGVAAVTRGSFKWTLKRITWMQERLHVRDAESRAPQYYILYGRADAGQGSGDTGKPNGIRFVAAPDTYYSMEIIYIPRPPQLLSERDGGSGHNFVAGWDQYVVYDSAIQCVDKRDADTRVLQGERESWLRSIEDAICPRDAGQPHEVIVFPERGGYGEDEDLVELLNG